MLPSSRTRTHSVAVVASLAAAAVCASRPALACGTSGPDGVSACSLAEHDEEVRPKWSVGLSGLYTSTSLHFTGDTHADETRAATVVSLSYAPVRAISVEAGLGAALGGKLTLPDGTYDFSTGPTATLGASWRVVDRKPFVLLTSQVSFTGAQTRRANVTAAYDAFDLRLGAVVGTTLWDALSPYALARVFGGPVYWAYAGQSVTGTDTHHFQIGAGFAWLIVNHVDLFVEGVPLGEQSVAAGVSVAF
jgi:hypothetical protein